MSHALLHMLVMALKLYFHVLNLEFIWEGDDLREGAVDNNVS